MCYAKRFLFLGAVHGSFILNKKIQTDISYLIDLFVLEYGQTLLKHSQLSVVIDNLYSHLFSHKHGYDMT